MIRFDCPWGFVDYLSWTPTADGVVIHARHSTMHEPIATIVISREQLAKLARLCEQCHGHTTWSQRPGFDLSLPEPGKKGGAP